MPFQKLLFKGNLQIFVAVFSSKEAGVFEREQVFAEAFLRMTLLLGVLMNLYHIFQESDYFESLVETCPKRKFGLVTA